MDPQQLAALLAVGGPLAPGDAGRWAGGAEVRPQQAHTHTHTRRLLQCTLRASPCNLLRPVAALAPSHVLCCRWCRPCGHAPSAARLGPRAHPSGTLQVWTPGHPVRCASSTRLVTMMLMPAATCPMTGGLVGCRARSAAAAAAGGWCGSRPRAEAPGVQPAGGQLPGVP